MPSLRAGILSGKQQPRRTVFFWDFKVVGEVQLTGTVRNEEVQSLGENEAFKVYQSFSQAVAVEGQSIAWWR